jgi:hypothetical protein
VHIGTTTDTMVAEITAADTETITIIIVTGNSKLAGC